PAINGGDAPTLYPSGAANSDAANSDAMNRAVPQEQYRNSEAEQQALGQIYAAASGEDAASIPGWTTLIAAPSLRGNEVVFK
ncbi:MAG: hypothetical protein L0H59_16135, partial [Tomitella sp.]|nr:hypothetical protein [Tomitella sp.]